MPLSLRQRVWRQCLALPARLPFPLLYGLAWLVYLLWDQEFYHVRDLAADPLR